MLKKILGTAGTRIIGAAISFVILVINSQTFGDTGLGTISLVVLGVAMVLLLNDFIGGGALIYFVPRIPTTQLFVPAYIWSVITAVIFFGVFHLVELVPGEYLKDVVLLALIRSFAAINIHILLGKERIAAYNILTLMQNILLIGVLSFLVFVQGMTSVDAFIFALYGSYGWLFLASLYVVRPYLEKTTFQGIGEVLKKVLRHGSYVQFANILQFLNYRLDIYLIEFFYPVQGKGMIGLYSAGNQLSEGLWILPRSVATVQGARIANSDDLAYSQRITLVLAKASFFITAIMMGALLLIPESVFAWIFGEDFSALGMVVLSLGIGIVSLSASIVFSHYFSGIGKHHINTIGSGIGVVVTLVAGLILIPTYGVIGAGITSSLSYLVSTGFHMGMMVREPGVRVRDIFPSRSDISTFKGIFAQVIGKKG